MDVGKRAPVALATREHARAVLRDVSGLLRPDR